MVGQLIPLEVSVANCTDLADALNGLGVSIQLAPPFTPPPERFSVEPSEILPEILRKMPPHEAVDVSCFWFGRRLENSSKRRTIRHSLRRNEAADF